MENRLIIGQVRYIDDISSAYKIIHVEPNNEDVNSQLVTIEYLENGERWDWLAKEVLSDSIDESIQAQLDFDRDLEELLNE